MPEVSLFAFDLDGTLLNSDKRLTPRTLRALERAAGQGAELVIASGRFLGSLPEELRSLSFLHYAILINGAQVADLRTGEILSQANLPLPEALAIMVYLDTLPVIYDCYMDDWGWMTASLQAQAADFAPDEHYLRLLREVRSPVPELKAFLREKGRDVQKIQFFMKDARDKPTLMKELARRFPQTRVSSAVVNNIEINAPDAHKGEALRRLAARLRIPLERTAAFGDGLNDLTMLRTAGLGVAMGNAEAEVKAAADRTTGGCDEDGVAAVLETLCIGGMN